MQKERFKSYVTINPYNKSSYVYENALLKRYQLKKFQNRHFYISFLQTKDIIITSLNISRNIPDEDLKDVIELKAYEELDLDQTLEYTIEFEEIPTPLHEKERKFQVFVTEPSILEETFSAITNKIHYIDHILPAPLLFKPLYTQHIIENDETHLFLYFQRDDTFLTLYHGGNLLYAKSLKYSFSDIAEKLSELKGQNVTPEEVMQQLSKEGLKVSDLDELHYYMQVFSEIFLYINDILIYAKRANNLEIIDKIFISSEIGFIKGIEEYSLTYLGQEAFDFNFNYEIETNEPYVEDLHFLMALCAKDIVEQGYEYANLTIFKRLPPLFKRPSGEILLVMAASTLLAIAYPAYNLIYAYKIKYETIMLNKEYPAIHAKKVALESQINRLKKEIEDIKKKISLKTQELKRREAILKAIYDKKVNYIMKGATIAELSQDLIGYKIKTTNIENNQTVFDLNVTAVDEKSITKFIRYISENKSSKYDITTQGLNKTDPNSTVYTSKIEVRVR